MGFYKKVKFPFEVTKGKAKDLYQLRFMRKSELEPSVRHNLRHNTCQMGRQLDLWFKEQLFTIGSLTKEQEKIHQSRKRLKTEIRRSKKRDYARKQEEIRIKLKQIRMRMLMMKVIQKFKDNVVKARSYRRAEASLKGNVDVLRVSGNKQLIHGSDRKQTTSHETGSHRDRGEKVSQKDYFDTVNYLSKHSRGKGEVTNTAEELTASGDEDNDADDYDPNYQNDLEETVRSVEDSLLVQRYPSSHGPRMETIPEEAEEVEIEMEDFRDLPRLTKTRLNQLNRSQSKRNIFDVNERVPLLPDVAGQHAHLTSDMGRPLPDTADKETQTSDKSKSDSAKRKKASHLRRRAETSECNGKKTIVVKLPRSKIITHKERDGSAKSNSGHFGSDDSDDDYNDETTDTDFAYGFESDLISSEYSEDDNAADDESSVNHAIPIPKECSFTLSKYKTALRRKAENSPTSQSIPSVTNLEANFPNISTFSVQNPFSLRYKERSFFVKPSSNERLTGSAKSVRRVHDIEEREIDSPRQTSVNVNKEAKKQRSEEIRKLLLNDNRIKRKEDSNIVVYGRKPDGSAGQYVSSPPNTPVSDYGYQGFSPRRVPQRTYQNNPFNTKRREKAEYEEKIHDVVSNEPVQKYERTRSGKIRPFGTPRIPNHEIPSLRDQYYRDKLLKAERDCILKQNIKMKRFIGTFDKGKATERCREQAGKGRDCSKLPTVSSGEDLRPEANVTTNSANRPTKKLGNILFKVYQPEQDVEYERKVVPGVTTTSLRLLKNCRYLREYKPFTGQDKEIYPEKETSWDLAKARADCSKAYLANVRVSLI